MKARQTPRSTEIDPGNMLVQAVLINSVAHCNHISYHIILYYIIIYYIILYYIILYYIILYYICLSRQLVNSLQLVMHPPLVLSRMCSYVYTE